MFNKDFGFMEKRLVFNDPEQIGSNEAYSTQSELKNLQDTLGIINSLDASTIKLDMSSQKVNTSQRFDPGPTAVLPSDEEIDRSLLTRLNARANINANSGKYEYLLETGEMVSLDFDMSTREPELLMNLWDQLEDDQLYHVTSGGTSPYANIFFEPLVLFTATSAIRGLVLRKRSLNPRAIEFFISRYGDEETTPRLMQKLKVLKSQSNFEEESISETPSQDNSDDHIEVNVDPSGTVEDNQIPTSIINLDMSSQKVNTSQRFDPGPTAVLPSDEEIDRSLLTRLNARANTNANSGKYESLLKTGEMVSLDFDMSTREPELLMNLWDQLEDDQLYHVTSGGTSPYANIFFEPLVLFTATSAIRGLVLRKRSLNPRAIEFFISRYGDEETTPRLMQKLKVLKSQNE